MLGWIQLTLRDIKRRVEVDMVQSNKFEESMDVLSVGYHGCCKIVSQPLPFAYEQLIAMLTQLYCFTVPVCFITSFGFYIFLPVYLIRSGLALASPSPSPNPNPNPNPSPNPSPSPSPNPRPNPNPKPKPNQAAGAARDEAGREPKAAPASGKKGFFGW